MVRIFGLVPDFKRIADIGWRVGEEEDLTQRALRRVKRGRGRKSGKFVRSDRKSPPFAKTAKGGAPSSSFVSRQNE